MEAISCGKVTKIFNFPDLKLLCSYGHPNELSSDIAFHTRSSFLITHKDYGFDLVKIKNPKDGERGIERLKTLRLNNLNCSAPQKKNTDFTALGLANDCIKIFNLKTNQWDKKFCFEKSNSPIHLDFSNCDEHLAGVFESGSIYIFGMKTGIKSDTISLDKQSAVAKFHPSKRFHLGVASYQGAVTIYDIQAKRSYFHDASAHQAPCSDIAFFPEVPDHLISVGYDNAINIFDTRKKTYALKIQSNCPYGSVATTNCGKLFIVSNLNAELFSYDIRNVKSPISMVKAHDKGIQHLLIYQSSDDRTSLASGIKDDCQLDYNQNISSGSFMDDILDFQRRRCSDISFVSRVSINNDFQDDIPDSRLSNEVRLSDLGLEKKTAADMFNDLSIDNLSLNSQQLTEELGAGKLGQEGNFVNTERLKKRQKPGERFSTVSQLDQIMEEHTLSIEIPEPALSPTNISAIDPKNSSTPLYLTPKGPSFASETQKRTSYASSTSNYFSPDVIVVDDKTDDEQSSPPKTNSPNAAPTMDPPFSKEFFKQEIEELKKSLQEQIHLKNQEILYETSGQTVRLNSSLWRNINRLEEKIDVLQDSVALLLQEDPLVNKVMEVQQENQELKAKMEELMRKLI